MCINYDYELIESGLQQLMNHHLYFHKYYLEESRKIPAFSKRLRPAKLRRIKKSEEYLTRYFQTETTLNELRDQGVL